jgi:hypothetical protein
MLFILAIYALTFFDGSFYRKKVKVIASRSGVLANMGPGELERKTSENRLDQNAFQYEHLNSLFIKNERSP